MCTTIIIGKKASKDGSVIIAHSDDFLGDARVIRVPSFNRKNRNIYYDNASFGLNKVYNSTEIRRYIGKDRGEWYDTKDYTTSKSLGVIPGFGKDTYAYFDYEYGIINEKGLMVGECTCGAKIQPGPEPNKRIFYSSELSRVALERCTKAREAVELIGKLIHEYGYYGTGETLLLGDADEGWVMEMCAYEEDGNSGIWVAQRVSDEEFFVAANQFRIRDIHKNAEDNDTDDRVYFYSLDENGKSRDDLLYSANLFNACHKANWITSDEKCIDWAATVSYGEYLHPYYSLRRVWRVFSKVAPLTNLPSRVSDGYAKDYPFSVKPDHKLSILDVANVFRDYYEGTEFDLTIGLASGQFKNPIRYQNNPDHGDTYNLNKYKPEGAWERTLSNHQCGVLWINQALKVKDNTEAVCWIGLDRPFASCLMPFYCKMDKLPKELQTMNLLDFQFNGDSAWWAFNFVSNFVNLNYLYMMREVKALQDKFETKAEKKVLEVLSSGDMGEFATYCTNNFEEVVKQWWNLASHLIVKYSNGCITTAPDSTMKKIDYPKNWLKEVGYYDGPTQY
jgi:dipeptidase